MTKRASVIDRLMSRVSEDAGGCWIYSGGTNGNGYGVVGSGGKYGSSRYVHRVTYQHFMGEIPKGLDLDHLCRNRLCCNPWHLEPVTRRVNLLRGVGVTARNAAVTHCPQGHEYDEPNTYVSKTGSRNCRQCAADYQRRRRRDGKAAS